MSRFAARSGGGELGPGRRGRHEPRVRSASAADADLLAGGSAFEVVAEVVAELVATDVDVEGVELRGLEPLAPRVPLWCSSS
jgi:hypothetical protein